MVVGRLTRAWLPVLAVTLLILLPATQARAADGGLLVVTDARYQVLPDEGRVHVMLDSVATSFEPDTDEGRIYYSGITFAVPADATNLSASDGSVRLTARLVEESDAYRAVEIVFGRSVFYRESYAYSVSFDLVDGGGAADRDVRIGHSLVAFPVWAFGTADEPGSSVRIDLPAGFQATVQGSSMVTVEGPTGTVLSARPDDPFNFFAYLSADRPGAYAETALRIPMRDDTAQITMRAWEDDPDWAARTSDLLSRGLPALEEMIGVPYPHAGRLDVEEAAVSRLGEYAGIYDPESAVIRIRYDADAFVALHEAAHLWFNQRLFDDRWIGEAWAEFYSIEVGQAMGATGFRWELTAERLESRVALNDWGAVGREDLRVEDFAYAASYTVATQVAARTDLDALKRVWQAAADREPSYLPPDGSSREVRRAPLGQPGWQRLLDLLEERTGGSYADLWAEWIVNDQQEPLLAERASSRAGYGALAERAGDWQLPRSICDNLGAWRFGDARDALAEAEAILIDRDRIARLAAELSLASSDRLRRAFEADDGLRAAANLADVELAILAELRLATERLGDDPSPLEVIGLIGSDPGALLDEARDAYQAGELGGAQRTSAAAIATRDEAAANGRSRVALGAGLVLATDGLVLVALSGRRLQRQGATLRVP